MAQPKGYAAFILFPHLKMIPLPKVKEAKGREIQLLA